MRYTILVVNPQIIFLLSVGAAELLVVCERECDEERQFVVTVTPLYPITTCVLLTPWTTATTVAFCFAQKMMSFCTQKTGAGIAQLVVLGLAVHGVAGSILLWGHFPVEGIFPLELTWVQTPFPQKLLRMRV